MQMLGSDGHMLAALSTGIEQGAIVQSITTMNMYRLMNKLMRIPRKRHRVAHSSLFGEKLKPLCGSLFSWI